MERNKWWGYLHTEGTIQAKRYWGEDSNLDIIDASESPFVKEIVKPFEADSREEAIEFIKSNLKLKNNLQ